MRDPIDELSNFDPGPAMTPMPATEVRRRGDRIRRRNNALAGVGALAAVAALAVPFAVFAGGNNSADPQPADPSQAVEWVQTVPADFPLANGLGIEGDPAHVGTEEGEVVFSAIAICNREVWSPLQPPTSDVLGAVWSDGIEGGEQRTLALYPDDETAQGALQGMRDAVLTCPEQTGPNAIMPIALGVSAGDDSLAYMDQYRDKAGPNGMGNAYVVTRVGNALLLDKTYFGGAGSMDIAQQTADQLVERSAGVVEAMCVFSATPCSTPAQPSAVESSSDPGTGEGAVSAIPPDFPLDRGLVAPEGDPLIGPSATGDGVPALDLCERSVWPVDGVERLAVTATGPEYLETRELVTFASSTELTAALDALREAIESCADVTPQDATPAGADDAVSFARIPEEGLGGEIYQFARVGRALYATFQSGEWSPETISSGIEQLTIRTEDLLPELCIWTETGC